MSTRLGEKLREPRKAKGREWTLERLAEAAGLSKSYFIEEDVREPEEKHLDEAFFRGYQKLEPDAKEQIRKILGAFQKK